MLVQIIVTKKKKVYVRIFGWKKTFCYEEEKDGRLEPCVPPKPGALVGAHVDQRIFEAAFWR